MISVHTSLFPLIGESMEGPYKSNHNEAGSLLEYDQRHHERSSSLHNDLDNPPPPTHLHGSHILNEPYVTLKTNVTIVSSCLGAIVLAVGHHAFLSRMNGQNVADTSQFYIKSANNLVAQVVTILIGIAATTSMIQMVSTTPT